MQFMSAVLQAGAVIICGGLWHFVGKMHHLGQAFCFSILHLLEYIWYEFDIMV